VGGCMHINNIEFMLLTTTTTTPYLLYSTYLDSQYGWPLLFFISF
jgi:hypothetical protein